jgi:CubicO group peptidase (beta-lactamase class C family)
MKRTISIILLALLVKCSCAQPFNDKRLTGLDTAITKVLTELHVPGVSLAIVKKGKVIYTGGFGYKDLKKQNAVTANTLFPIASCTKAFTTTLIGLLQQEGKLDIDKPVRQYLPELRFYNNHLSDHVTIRDMMTHRTGLPRHDASWFGANATRNELIQRIQYLEPNAELREKYQYNNFMYAALGVVIEKITGRSWEENIRERIFKPLQMHASNLSVPELEKATDKFPGYAYTQNSTLVPIPYRNVDALGPAGAINSNASDMAKWLLVWTNKGKYSGKEILPTSFYRDAITTQIPMGGGLPGVKNPDIYFTGYGFGWEVNSYRGYYRVNHTGGIDGFASMTVFYPTDSLGIFLASSNSAANSVIRNIIADRLLGLPYKNWLQAQLDEINAWRAVNSNTTVKDSLHRKQGTKSSLPLQSYSGTYIHPGYGEIKISVVGKELHGKFNGYDLRLEHYHFDQFLARPMGERYDGFEPFQFRFHLDNKGEVEKLAVPFEPLVKAIEFKKHS